MKRVDFLLALLVISLVFAACSSTKITDSEIPEQSGTETQTESNTDTQDSMITEETEESEEGEMDVSLLDRALLKSIEIKYPDTSEIVYEGTSEWVEEGETLTSTSSSIMYTRGFDTRQENIDEDRTYIDIYLYEEGIEYSYEIGETTGYKYYDDEEDRADKEKEIAYEGMSLLDYIEEEITAEQDLVLKAWRDKIAGRKAICIELTGEEEDDQGNMVETKAKIWYDAKYLLFLRYEVTMFDTFYVFEAVDVKINKKIDDDLFLPPDDVEFPE